MLVFLCALLSLLAGRALAAFNITAGNQVLLAGNILDIPDSAVKSACSAKCDLADTGLKNCRDDSACLCQKSIVSTLLDCEQCMYNFLVANFQEVPDPKAGSQAILTAYAAACTAANQPLEPTTTKLSLAPNWNGPLDVILDMGASIVVVGIGGLLGASAMFLFSKL